MATAEQVTQLRYLANYTATDPYDDAQLSAMIDDAGGVYRVTQRLWQERAASVWHMVSISESGSSRSSGDAYKNALALAAYFGKLADQEETTEPIDTTRFARTRAIIREG